MFKNESAKKYANNEQVQKKLKEFLQFKIANPTQQFGGKDKPMSNKGHFEGMMHCGLTFDVSVFYRISGSNPRIISIYGLFSHDESGTGQPPNIKRQKSLASRFNQQVFS